MKRIVFFAHYDPDGRVDDYVLHYLNELVRAGIEEIYFASDCGLVEEELSKLPNAVEVVNATRHGEYDFGSWKRCFDSVTLSERFDVDELMNHDNVSYTRAGADDEKKLKSFCSLLRAAMSKGSRQGKLYIYKSGKNYFVLVTD